MRGRGSRTAPQATSKISPIRRTGCGDGAYLPQRDRRRHLWLRHSISIHLPWQRLVEERVEEKDGGVLRQGAEEGTDGEDGGVVLKGWEC